MKTIQDIKNFMRCHKPDHKDLWRPIYDNIMADIEDDKYKNNYYKESDDESN